MWGIGIFLLIIPFRVYGYSVPPLPEDNLLINPWFRSTRDLRVPGLEGWTNVLQNGIGWGTSQKVDNPSPEIIVSGKCGFKEVYCGTGARWANETADKEVSSYPGLDVYLYQVVKTDSTHRKLKFFMYWVNHKLDVFEVKIYGADAPDGPWLDVWDPFFLTQNFTLPPGETPGHGGMSWLDTGTLEAVFDKGYSYYKVEFHARYPEADTAQGNVGVKFTGVYFTTEFTERQADESPKSLIINATRSDSSQNSNHLGDQSTPPVNPERTRLPAPTKLNPTPVSTRIRPTPASTNGQQDSTPTNARTNSVTPSSPSLKLMTLAGGVAGLLVLGVIFFLILAKRNSD